MGHPRFSTHKICERGKLIYEQKLRPLLDIPENYRKILIIWQMY